MRLTSRLMRHTSEERPCARERMRQAWRMPYIPDEKVGFLLVQAMQELGVTQERFGDMVGVSRRTVTRWFSNGTAPSPDVLAAAARMLHAKNPTLAAELAGQTGYTLEALGIVKPAPPPPAPPPVRVAPPAALAPPPSPPPRPAPPAAVLAESIVCAAADALGTTPAGVRDVVRATFRRARATGLTVEEIDDVFSPAPPAATELAGKGEGAVSRTRAGKTRN